MNLIAAVDRNWAIGNKGQLLVRIPNDHKMFRQETMDKVIVYGRKTLETFPLSQPLDRRVNIILSKNPDLRVRHAQVVHSVEDAFFPNLDEDPEWEITADSDEMTYFDIAYQFVKYERRKD